MRINNLLLIPGRHGSIKTQQSVATLEFVAETPPSNSPDYDRSQTRPAARKTPVWEAPSYLELIRRESPAGSDVVDDAVDITEAQAGVVLEKLGDQKAQKVSNGLSEVGKSEVPDELLEENHTGPPKAFEMSSIIDLCHTEVKKVKHLKTTKEWFKDPGLYRVRTGMLLCDSNELRARGF